MQLSITDKSHSVSVHQVTPPGVTLGRASTNHIVLTDESKQISLMQAIIRVQNRETLILKNMGSLEIQVNQTSLPLGKEIVVHAGDNIRIGDYTCTVSKLPSAPTVMPMPNQPAMTGHYTAISPKNTGFIPEKTTPTQAIEEDILGLNSTAPTTQQPINYTKDIFAELLGVDAVPIGASHANLHPFEFNSKLDKNFHDPLSNLDTRISIEQENDPLKIIASDGNEHLNKNIFSNPKPSTLNIDDSRVNLTELDRLLDEINQKH
ncbi:hypothetical protein V757_12030 [Pelistega indica]|uniref:FHA domain-containing protein n=1 Tax=Pelistega indica TaxID=1414851 RepID=V8FRG9_9BURK|nr:MULTISPECIES: FHA domain-containing protein [Pelistega]ETD66894.1 hypothetical protein V757_12030 [Pelistega indica]